MGSRYYDTTESGEEIRPGRISNELRQALNIPENDLPIWIYRMRALGYPPGWLKKAVVDTKDIFDTDSPAPDGPEEGAEQPQTSDSEPKGTKRKLSDEDQVQYDHSKLIEYPGFNAPLPKGVVDYHYFVNMPAMMEHQQLEYAKQHMNAFKPAPLPKRTRLDTSAEDSLNTADESTATNAANSSLVSQTSNESVEASSSQDEPSADTSQLSTTSAASLKEQVKLVSTGSPMPKNVDRPPLENFSEGVVGELLYFENLPASTGRFENIRGMLDSMRKSTSGNSGPSENKPAGS